MKIKKLLLFSLLGLFTYGPVCAQSWTAPTVGIDISAGADGTTPYYMYNLESNVFMAYGFTWGTRAYATQLWNTTDTGQQVYVTADGTNYKLSMVKLTTSKNIFCTGGATGIYADNTTNADWTLTSGAVNYSYKLTNTTYSTLGYMVPSTSTGGYIMLSTTATNNEWAFIPVSSVATDYALYRAKLLLYKTLNEANTLDATTYATQISTAATVYNTATSTAADLISAAQTLTRAIAPSADDSHPVDMTCLLTNAGFESFSSTGWTTSGITGAYGYGCYEMYGSPFTLTQTITVPNGKYKAGVTAFHRPAATTTTDYAVYLTANNAQSRLLSLYNTTEKAKYSSEISGASNFNNSYANNMYTADEVFAMGAYSGNSVETTVGSGSLTIGLSSTESSQWTLFDKFTLTYYGADLQSVLDALVTTASAFTSSQVPNSVYTTLQADITTAGNASTDELRQASIDALNTHISLANSIESPYASCLAFITTCASVRDHSTPDAASNLTTFTTAVSTATSNVETSTTVTAVNSVYNTLEAALRTYAGVCTPADGYPIDFTYRITNPSFETGDFTGWSNTLSNSNITVGTYSYTGSAGTKAANIWYGFGAGSQNSLLQTITGMPMGQYILTAAVNGYTSKKSNGGPSVLYITGNGTQSCVTIADNGTATTNTATASVSFPVTTANASFAIGIVSQWFYQADNFVLQYYGKGAVITAYETALATAKGYANGSLTATLLSQLQIAIADVPATYADYPAKTARLNELIALAPQSQAIAEGSGTSLLVNPDMSNGTTGWTTSFWTQTNNVSSGVSGTFLENWVAAASNLADFNTYQIVSNLPAGQYTLSAYCVATQQGNSGEAAKTGVSGVSLYAGSSTTSVATLNDGIAVKFTVTVTVSEGDDLTVGFKGTSCTANWVAIDNFTLDYSPLSVSTLETGESEVDGAISQTALNAIQATIELNKFSSIKLTNASGSSLTLSGSDNPNLLVIDAPSTTTLEEGIPVTLSSGSYSFNNATTTLTDTKPFYSPVAISGNLEYRRTFKGVSPDNTGGWEVITLPFAPTSVTATIGGSSVNFYPYPVWAAQTKAQKEANGFYWIKQTGTTASETADAINRDLTAIGAHQPYIIAFPYYSSLATDYPQLAIDQSSGVEFTFAGSGVSATQESKVNMSNFAFNPVFTAKEVTDGYYLNAAGDAFEKVTGATEATAFRPYITATSASGIQARRFNIGGDNDLTAVDELIAHATASYLLLSSQQGGIAVKAQKEALLLIFDTTGRLVKKMSVKEENEVYVPLASGVYLINNQKFIVK